ncbi:MAG: nucleoside triphosphate pyrophosphatase [Rhodospirillales bacterium]|jgi:septum formation protein
MIVLASASKARSRMLTQAGVSHLVEVSRIDEDDIKQREAHHIPDRLAVRLAEAKAGDVSLRHPGMLVLGADQVLVCSGRPFSKPKTYEEAKEQLLALKGRTHRLVSAAVLVQDGVKLWHGCLEARLHMRSFSDAFLKLYLEREGENVLHSVGAYRVEGPGAQLFETIEGDHFTVQGLPLLPLLEELRRQGEIMA